MSDLDSFLYQLGENSIITMYVYEWWLLSKGGGGECPPPPMKPWKLLHSPLYMDAYLGVGTCPVYCGTWMYIHNVLQNNNEHVQYTHYNYAVSVIELEDCK